MFHSWAGENRQSAEIKVSDILTNEKSAEKLFMNFNVLKDNFSNLISVAKEAKSSSFGTESAITSTIIKTWFCIPSDTTLTVTFRCTGD